MYYILNQKTDENFCTIDNRFYSCSWSPTLNEDKDYLQSLITSDTEKFRNCIVFEVELNE